MTVNSESWTASSTGGRAGWARLSGMSATPAAVSATRRRRNGVCMGLGSVGTGLRGETDAVVRRVGGRSLGVGGFLAAALATTARRLDGGDLGVVELAVLVFVVRGELPLRVGGKGLAHGGHFV